MAKPLPEESNPAVERSSHIAELRTLIQEHLEESNPAMERSSHDEWTVQMRSFFDKLKRGDGESSESLLFFQGGIGRINDDIRSIFILAPLRKYESIRQESDDLMRFMSDTRSLVLFFWNYLLPIVNGNQVVSYSYFHSRSWVGIVLMCHHYIVHMASHGYCDEKTWDELKYDPLYVRVQLELEFEQKVKMLRESEANSKPPKATTSQSIPPGIDEPAAIPKDYVIGWADILQTLMRDNNPTEKGKVERLNELKNGPIIKGGTGQQPIAEKTELIHWWNNLGETWTNRQSVQTNTAATLEEQYSHGRDAIVVPGIGGQVKKRQIGRAHV